MRIKLLKRWNWCLFTFLVVLLSGCNESQEPIIETEPDIEEQPDESEISIDIFTGDSLPGAVLLTWQNPKDQEQFQSIMIRRSATETPASPFGGELVYRGSAENFYDQDNRLAEGSAYYYKIYAQSIFGKYYDGPEIMVSVGLVDITPPAAISNLQVISLNEGASLSWQPPRDVDFSDIVIVRKINAPPKSIDDGEQIIPSSQSSHIDENLVNGVTYYYALFSQDNAGNLSSAAITSVTPTIEDNIGPEPVTNVQFVVGNGFIDITWDNPIDAAMDFDSVYVIRNTSQTPQSIDDGIQISQTTTGHYLDTDVMNEQNYFYGIFALDINNNASPLVTGGAVPDGTPPGQVSNVITTPFNGYIALNWTNANDVDFSHVVIVRNPTNAPADINDGVQIFQGNAIAISDVSLINEQLYHYAFFSVDQAGNHSQAFHVQASPDGIAPDNVTALEVTGLNEKVGLSWINPPQSDFSSVYVVRKLGASPPANLNDGDLIFAGNNTSGFDDQSQMVPVVNNQVYSYTLFSEDFAGNFSSGVSQSATPLPSGTLNPNLNFELLNNDGFNPALTVDSNGRTVISGWANHSNEVDHHLVVARFLQDGNLDTSFASTGIFTQVNSGINFYPQQVLTLNNNHTVVVGILNNGVESDAFIFMLDELGALDTSFAGSGFLIIDDLLGYSASSADGFYDVVSDGNALFVSGNAQGADLIAQQMVVVKITPSGTLANDFGNFDKDSDGVLTDGIFTDPTTDFVNNTRLNFAHANLIYVVGNAQNYSDIYLWALDSAGNTIDGAFDTSPSGFHVLPDSDICNADNSGPVNIEAVNDFDISPAGRLFLAGTCFVEDEVDHEAAMIIALNSNGTALASFPNPNAPPAYINTVVEPGSLNSYFTSIQFDSTGAFYAAGHKYNGVDDGIGILRRYAGGLLTAPFNTYVIDDNLTSTFQYITNIWINPQYDQIRFIGSYFNANNAPSNQLMGAEIIP